MKTKHRQQFIQGNRRMNRKWQIISSDHGYFAIVDGKVITQPDANGYAHPTREMALNEVAAWFDDEDAEDVDTYQGVTYPAQCERM